MCVCVCVCACVYVCVCVCVCQGRRNFIILLLAVCFAAAGSVLTGLSKWDNSATSQNTTTTSVTTTSTDHAGTSTVL